MHDNCKTCKWWYSEGSQRGKFSRYAGNTSEIKIGECRRYPPDAVPTALREAYCKASGVMYKSLESSAVWPKTHASDWCGEHCPKIAAAHLE